jgi:anti-anti-sigma factor
MKITTRTVGDIRILDCNGKITMDGGGTMFLRNTLHDVLQSGNHKIVIDLGRIKFIDRPGMDELVNVYDSVTHDGGQVRLLNLTKKISDPMVITKLMMVFKSYNDEKTALASFQ